MNACYLAVKLSFYSYIQETKYHFCIVPICYEIRFEDSPPDVPDTALPRLFERLYRVESSRNRATGGAGIGLSICHNIVTAHDGSISAHHAALGGLEIRVRLPLNT